jgi:hypothetical protein
MQGDNFSYAVCTENQKSENVHFGPKMPFFEKNKCFSVPRAVNMAHDLLF